MHPLELNARRVTIGDERKVFHYEVESEEEEDEGDENDGFVEQEREMEQEQETAVATTHHLGYKQDSTQYSEMKMYDDEDDIKEDSNLFVIEQAEQEKVEVPLEMQPQEEIDVSLHDLRVFAGNIGRGPLFHTFSITYQTATDELVKLAVHRFGVQEEHDNSKTIEYYVAVQGLDGDEYILSAQDKPLSIFKTLTDSLTTPMPSLSNYRRISQQSVSSSASPGKRPRSSSFSNYEQTNHDEDSVIRFYLHRRIKRAHENLVYIKVSLYPDTHKQKKPHEMDRMDKVIAVKQESTIGQVIQLALEKFHVPDENLTKQLKKYKLSVKSHHGKGKGIKLLFKETAKKCDCVCVCFIDT